VECIAQSTARLVVNRASLKLKHAVVTELIKKLRTVSSIPTESQTSVPRKVRRTVRRTRT